MRYTSLSLIGFNSITPGSYQASDLKQFIVTDLRRSNLEPMTFGNNLFVIGDTINGVEDVNGIRRVTLESRDTFRISIKDANLTGTLPVHITAGMCIRLEKGGYIRAGFEKQNGGFETHDISIPANEDNYFEIHYIGPRTNPRSVNIYLNGVMKKTLTMSSSLASGVFMGLWSASGNTPGKAYVSDIYIASNVNNSSNDDIPLFGPIVVGEGTINIDEANNWMTGTNIKPSLDELNATVNGLVVPSDGFQATSIVSGGYKDTLTASMSVPSGESYLGACVNINLFREDAVGFASITSKNGANGGSVSTPVNKRGSVQTNVSATIMQTNGVVSSETINSAIITITSTEPKI